MFFLCSGISISKSELAEHLEVSTTVGSEAWSLPIMPFDSAASTWPGSGKTLYELGKRQTRVALEEIATRIALVEKKPERKPLTHALIPSVDSPAASISTALSFAGLITACRLLWPRGMN
jgi:hypothetical protein